MARREILLPDLGFSGEPIVAGVWLVRRGARVKEGQPLLEIVAGSAVIDLPAPADGTLVCKLVDADDRLEVGQCLAIVESEEA